MLSIYVYVKAPTIFPGRVVFDSTRVGFYDFNRIRMMNTYNFAFVEKRSSSQRISRQSGFSMAELLVVLGVIAIMSAISVPYLLNYRKVYRTDDQAIKMMDMMRETGQLALTRRRTMRFEIDLTDNTMKLIDENGTGTDTLVKSIPLDKVADVRVDVTPTGVTIPNPPNYTNITFATDSVGHLNGSTSVNGHSVWSARFQRDGSVVNNAGTPISVSICIFPPTTVGSATPKSKPEVRAITLFGGSGAIRYWKHNGTTFVAT